MAAVIAGRIQYDPRDPTRTLRAWTRWGTILRPRPVPTTPPKPKAA